MIILPVSFKGVAGRPAGRGQIAITNPAGTINFTRAQIRPADATVHPNAVQHTLAGSWSGFPEGGVRHLEVSAHTDRDYSWFKIPVNGAAQGNFSGEMFIWHTNRITPVRFDGFDLMRGQPMFSAGYYSVRAKFIDEPLPLAQGEAIVTFPEEFAARISRVVRGRRGQDQVPVFVWFDVQRVPAGTDSLSLSFVTGRRDFLQDIKVWEGPDQYAFIGQIEADHPGVIGLPTGKVGVGCILRATRQERVLGTIRESFAL